ncbi:MAG: hypothetical protein FJ404_05650 [Verrucomicrobia bacterium]|nr:hypothetical protein [Verrucomicrobiota bacterium]
MTTEPTQPAPAADDSFRTTRWTQVSRAQADSPEGLRALTELCGAYYEPVAAFLRCELRDAEAARDLAHDFFATMLADASVLSPDAAFDRQWAVTVLARALEALRQECVAGGRGEFFERVKPWLTGEAAHGDQTALAAQCGLNANALKVAVHRLRCIPMLPVMQVGRVRPGAPPEHDVLHPVGGGLGQARPTNNIGMHGIG